MDDYLTPADFERAVIVYEAEGRAAELLIAEYFAPALSLEVMA